VSLHRDAFVDLLDLIDRPIVFREVNQLAVEIEDDLREDLGAESGTFSSSFRQFKCSNPIG
jgi:hypothetical protein